MTSRRVLHHDTPDKAPLRLHLLGQIIVKGIRFTDYYDDEDISAIKARYIPNAVTIVTGADDIPSTWKPILCGEAVIYL